MRAHEIEAKMFYISASSAGYRLWVDDVTLYEAENMVQITYRWLQHPRRNVLNRDVITQRMHWTGYWQYVPEVYEITELP
jgi:hypothetical protein